MFPEAKLGYTQEHCYTFQLKSRKQLRRNRLLYAGWLKTLTGLRGSRTDHVLVEIQVVVSLWG